MTASKLRGSRGINPGKRSRHRCAHVMHLTLAGLCLAAAGAIHAAQDPPLPYAADEVHLGVATCAASMCHGSVMPFEDSRILHNEFITWQTDRYGNMHAKAYAKLLTPEAKSMADKLGLGSPERAGVCLDCHTDHVPEELRGERFLLSDGVGCEACHGGAGDWISSHTSPQASLDDNLARGMFPTHDPVQRGRLCLSCHLGNGNRMITHRIMAAGHPRLSFELDTFTYLQPHHEVTDDYIRRKGPQNGVRDWAVGQALAARQILELMKSPEHGWEGVFPELVLFDCHACHRPMTDLRWQPREGTGLGPGVMRVNDANLVILRLILVAVDPELSQRLKDQTRALHQATLRGRDPLLSAAADLTTTLNTALSRAAQFDFTAGDLRKIFARLIEEGEQGELLDYAAGEQAAMAASNLVAAYQETGVLDGADVADEIDRVYAAVADENAYTANTLVDALRDLQARMP